MFALSTKFLTTPSNSAQTGWLQLEIRKTKIDLQLHFAFSCIVFIYTSYSMASQPCQQSEAMRLEATAWVLLETWHVTLPGRDTSLSAAVA